MRAMRAAELSYSAGRDFRVRPEVHCMSACCGQSVLCFGLKASGAWEQHGTFGLHPYVSSTSSHAAVGQLRSVWWVWAVSIAGGGRRPVFTASPQMLASGQSHFSAERGNAARVADVH
jgi:hypothetical protein